MYKIILSSTNSAKKNAVIRFFNSQKIEFELFCFDVESGVDKTPESDEDGIIGCQNRIKNAKIEWEKYKTENLENENKLQNFETNSEQNSQEIANQNANQKTIFIGMEGIINRNCFGVFLGGWVCLEIENSEFLGSSARCQLPIQIVQKSASFKELSEITKAIYPQKADQINEIGTNGILTGGLYTRIDEFEDALKCSWGIYLGNCN